MSEQLDLLARSADHRKSLQFRDQVFAVLEDGAWHRAKALCERFPGLTDRALRQMAEDARGAVVSGNQWYKLTRFATVEELDHFERAQLSQARKTINRVRLTRIARNRGVAA